MSEKPRRPLKIIAFRAVNEYQRCLEYIQGHRKVLEVHGFTHFLSNEESWMFNPETIVVMVYNEDMTEALGGARFERRMEDNLLSFERVLLSSEPEVVKQVQRRVRGGTGEICGLWNSKEVAGLNTSILLVRGVIVSLWQQHMNTIFAFNARYTNRIPIRLGFERMTVIGNNGYVPYPDDRFQAAIWRFERKNGLKRAVEYERKTMRALIEKPKQVLVETDIYENLEIHYDLEVETP